MEVTLTCYLLLTCIPAAHARMVVPVHLASGDFVLAHNLPSPRAEAVQRANTQGRGGDWKLF